MAQNQSWFPSTYSFRNLLVQRELPEWNLKLSRYTKGKERPQEEADVSGLVGGRFNKQRNLHTRLGLGGRKTSTALHSPTRILKVYIEALTGFSHIYHPESLNTTLLSQGSILRAVSGNKEGKWNTHSKDGEWVGSPSPDHASTNAHIFSVTPSTPLDWLTISHMPPSAMFPEQSTRGFSSIRWLI